MKVVELYDPRDIRVLNYLINKYHKQRWKPGLSKMRFFVGVVEKNGADYWVAGAVLQTPIAFARSLINYKIDITNSYFIRRICSFCPCRDYLVEFIKLLAEKIASEGRELLITFGLEDHTNKLYKLAGFKEIGVTSSGKPIYILDLKEIRKSAKIEPKTL